MSPNGGYDCFIGDPASTSGYEFLKSFASRSPARDGFGSSYRIRRPGDQLVVTPEREKYFEGARVPTDDSRGGF